MSHELQVIQFLFESCALSLAKKSSKPVFSFFKLVQFYVRHLLTDFIIFYLACFTHFYVIYSYIPCLVYIACKKYQSGIRCLFDPWIRDPEWVFSGSRISDPGSQDHILKSFLTIFLIKSSIIL